MCRGLKTSLLSSSIMLPNTGSVELVWVFSSLVWVFRPRLLFCNSVLTSEVGNLIEPFNDIIIENLYRPLSA